jgi:hypothetical protein
VKLKPWYDVVKPREDLREGKPLDASEFAVHLDKVRLGDQGNAPEDYRNPPARRQPSLRPFPRRSRRDSQPRLPPRPPGSAVFAGAARCRRNDG